jgi:hypothetical protein
VTIKVRLDAILMKSNKNKQIDRNLLKKQVAYSDFFSFFDCKKKSHKGIISFFKLCKIDGG